MGYLGSTWTQVFTRVRAERTSHSEMSQWSRWETGLASANDVTHRKRAEDFGILKNSVSWVETCLGRRRLNFACAQRPWAGVARDGVGGRWKSQSRKNVYLSPYVDEPLNSKVIKGFVPELRSRKCFLCFEIPMFYVIWVFGDPSFLHITSMAYYSPELIMMQVRARTGGLLKNVWFSEILEENELNYFFEYLK